MHLYKGPEQNDVTPSTICIDKRGNRYVGARAYSNAALNPDSAATLVRLDRPAAEIVAGNPSIADVSVQSGKVLVVTGKAARRTSLSWRPTARWSPTSSWSFKNPAPAS